MLVQDATGVNSRGDEKGGEVAESGGELTGQARRGVERRQAIVEAAIEVFAQHGFRGGALAEVAARVDLSAAGILYHFGSKEDLLLAVIAERDFRQLPTLLALGDRAGFEPISGALVFAEQSERERGLTMLHTVLEAESLDPAAPAHEYFLHRSRALRGRTEEVLRGAQDRGQVRADVDCRAIAEQITAFFEGAAMLWLMDDSTSLVEIVRSYLDVLERAIYIGPEGDE
jgi:AcrR family transcriptional regulator